VGGVAHPWAPWGGVDPGTGDVTVAAGRSGRT
jgi:hypothetical protein